MRDGRVSADEIPYHFQVSIARSGLPGLTGEGVVTPVARSMVATRRRRPALTGFRRWTATTTATSHAASSWVPRPVRPPRPRQRRPDRPRRGTRRRGGNGGLNHTPAASRSSIAVRAEPPGERALRIPRDYRWETATAPRSWRASRESRLGWPPASRPRAGRREAGSTRRGGSCRPRPCRH